MSPVYGPQHFWRIVACHLRQAGIKMLPTAKFGFAHILWSKMFETFSKKTFAMWNFSNIFINAEERAKTEAEQARVHRHSPGTIQGHSSGTTQGLITDDSNWFRRITSKTIYVIRPHFVEWDLLIRVLTALLGNRSVVNHLTRAWEEPNN